MEEETIYNIIPKQYIKPPKQPRYKSKYPPTLPPTASTFCLKTTSKPGINNLSGQFIQSLSPHSSYGQSQTFGHLKGQRKSSPDNFRKKNTGKMGDNSLPLVKQYSYNCIHKKQQVPSLDDKPIMGLKSSKNFIISNAIQNILSIKKAPKEDINWLSKKQFGKVPQYLEKIKQNINIQYKTIKNMQANQPKQQYCLSQRQINQLRQSLRNKWEQVNKQYQKITHKNKMDTIGLKRKKQQCQGQLEELQKDIKKLNKMYIFVDKK